MSKKREESKATRLAPLLAGIGLGVVGTALVAGWLVCHSARRGTESVSAPTRDHQHGDTAAAAEKRQLYMCPMMCIKPRHRPGRCPVCGMDLVPAPDNKAQGEKYEPRLVMSEAAMKLAEVRTTSVERRFVDLELSLTGKVDFDETRVKTISAWVPGRLERIYVDNTGTVVKKGDPLVKIYSPRLNAEKADYLAVVLGGWADRSGDRSVSKDEWIKITRARLILMGLTNEQIDEIEKRKAPGYTENILSPIGGTVTSKSAKEGMYVKEGGHLYTVADLSRVWVWLDAYESDIPFLRYGQDVAVKVEAYGDEVFRGWISFTGPVLNAKTRTTRVRVVAENRNGRLMPNMFVRAVVKVRVGDSGAVVPAKSLAGKWISPRHPEIIRDKPGPCPVCKIALVRAEDLGYAAKGDLKPPVIVPASSVLFTGKRGIVYIKKPGTEKPTFEGVEVALGPRVGDYYVIRSGLREGQEIVTNGAFKIDSALQLVGRPSMMMRRSKPGKERPHAHGAARSTGTKQIRRTAPPAAFRARLGGIVKTYYEVQQALGKDDAATAKAKAAALAELVGGMDTKASGADGLAVWQGAGARLRALAETLSRKDDLEAQRVTFFSLSATLETLVRRFGPLPGVTVRRAFCPMAFNNKGAHWLQEAETILNPYEGSRMPQCGSIVETLSEQGK